MSVVPQESQSARKTPAPKPKGLPSGDPLFTNLLASKPPKQRRLGVWLIAAALHVPLVLYAFFAHIAPRIEAWQEETFRTIMMAEEPAQPMSGPVAGAPAAAQPARPPAQVSPQDTRRLSEPTAAGIPTPGSVPPPPSGEPTGATTTGAGGGRSLTDRLAPPSDPVLFGRVEVSPPTGIETVRERVAGTLRAYNDSVAAALAAAENATDWTVKDKDGKRWGVSPGKLHLGGVTLPLPVAFATPPGRRDEVAARNRSYTEIEQQATRMQLKDSFEERVKAIRDRKERERAEKRKPVTTSN